MHKLKRFDHDHALHGIRIEHGRGLRIIRNWFSVAAYIMLGWSAVWFGLIYFFLSLGGHSLEWVAFFPMLPGIVVMYVAITRFFNYTLIDVNQARLIVRHLPLPLIFGKQFATRDIDYLYGDIESVYTQSGMHIYRVMVMRQDGKKRVLLSGLEMSGIQMDFIVSAINTYLQDLS